MGKMAVALFLFLFLSWTAKAQAAGEEYIDKHKKIAIMLMRKSGIPASIILGVSMIESAMGKSRNCRLLHNYFGIKGKNNLHKGKSKHRSAYKQYPSAAASFKDFVRIVQTKKYYAHLKDTMDYKKWLIKMNQHGYAAAKGKWIKDVESVIKKYELADFDKETVLFEEDSFSIWGTDSTMIELQD